MKLVSRPETFPAAAADQRFLTWREPAVRAGLGAAALLLVAWMLAPTFRMILLSGSVVSADEFFARTLHGASGPALVAFMQAVSLLHSTAALLTFAALGMLAAWHTGLPGRLTAVQSLLVTLPGGLLLNFAVKSLVQRARPAWGYAYQAVESFSFPSGHTAGATLLYGLLAFGLWPHLRSNAARMALLAAAAGMVVLVAASRIVLGVHFFSDCVAGVLEALVWLCICLAGLGGARVLWPLQAPMNESRAAGHAP